MSGPPTRLREAYLPRFLSLTPEEAQRTKDCVRAAHGDDGAGGGADVCEDGLAAYHYCDSLEFDLARVVLSMARQHDAIGRSAIEKLVGRPILDWGPSVEAKMAAPAAARAGVGPEGRPKEVDSRIVVSVAIPCPRRVGSEAAEAYVHWREGDTVQQCLDRGLPARSLRRDVRHGHVVLGPPARKTITGDIS